MDIIKLPAVLAEIEQCEQGGGLHTFSIGYVKTNGQRGEKLRCRKSGSLPQQGPTTGGKFRYNVKENGVLLLTNLDNNQPFTLVIAQIVIYNGVRVWH